ncbi:MAG: TonB-dependent receptor [Myxococcales bacterium]|nr:TonB-dependent receptor [Myxococcales bacterium]
MELSAPWLRALAVDDVVGLDAQRERVIAMRSILSEVAGDGRVDGSGTAGEEVVEVESRAPLTPGRQRIDIEVARTVPGAGSDVLKVVESIAGVSRSAPGRAELVVWGAAPQDTRVLVNGVPVPSLYHVGGWRAAVGGTYVTDLALEPGAFGPQHGNAIGGIVSVETEAPAGDGLMVAADVLDVAGSAHRQVGDTRVAVAGRWSYLDRVVAAVADDVGDLVPVPQWADANVEVQHPWRGGQLRGFVVGVRDRLTRTLEASDPAERKRQRRDNDTLRLGSAWSGPAAGGSARVTGYLGRDSEHSALAFGEVPASLTVTRWLLGGRGEQTQRIGEAVLVTLGAQAEIERATLHRDGSLGTPAREGDIAIFGQPPGDDVASDDWSTVTGALAGHLAFDVVRGPWTLSPGLRLDSYLLTASRVTPKIGGTPEIGFQRIEFETQPRVALRYQRGFLAYSAQAGWYAQPRQASDASAVFGTPTLGVERALHVALGAAYQRGPITLEATSYLRRLDDLVARHPAATPPVTGALTQDGSGLVLGGQLVAKLAAWKGLTGWLSYGVSRSERRDATSLPQRRFDHDQTHLATLVVGWRLARWAFGARFRLASGEPRTAVLGAFVDARSGRYQPILGAHNAERLPPFAQLDLRVERASAVAGGELAVYLELQNVSSRRNAEEIVYSADYADRGYLTGLPLLAVLGARWQR